MVSFKILMAMGTSPLVKVLPCKKSELRVFGEVSNEKLDPVRLDRSKTVFRPEGVGILHYVINLYTINQQIVKQKGSHKIVAAFI
jgi:hypothetical protein